METATLDLTAMAHGGAALGRIDGKAVFVPYTLPGERVRVAITDDRGRYAFGQATDVIERSPKRVEPPCPYFGPGRCGGCQWQHIDYETQVRLKADILVDQLARIGSIDAAPVQPTLPDSSGWAYRNRARFRPARDGGLGFLVAGSDDALAIDECAVLQPALQRTYRSLDLELEGLVAVTLRVGVATGDQLLLFETEEDAAPLLEVDLPVSCALLRSDGEVVDLIGGSSIRERVGGHAYRISGPAFFQANTVQAERLTQIVLRYLELQGDDVVLDAYSGVGLFTAPLAERAGLVVAIEVDPIAVVDLVENTAEYDNVEVIEGPVEAALPGVEYGLAAAVVDPPRAGLDRAALDALVALQPARIAYVSCDPATLARDARRLVRHGYTLREVQPVDMFPQTFHIESVALFGA